MNRALIPLRGRIYEYSYTHGSHFLPVLRVRCAKPSSNGALSLLLLPRTTARCLWPGTVRFADWIPTDTGPRSVLPNRHRSTNDVNESRHRPTSIGIQRARAAVAVNTSLFHYVFGFTTGQKRLVSKHSSSTIHSPSTYSYPRTLVRDGQQTERSEKSPSTGRDARPITTSLGKNNDPPASFRNVVVFMNLRHE